MRTYKGIQPSTPLTLYQLTPNRLREGAMLAGLERETKPWFMYRMDDAMAVDLATYLELYRALGIQS